MQNQSPNAKSGFRWSYTCSYLATFIAHPIGLWFPNGMDNQWCVKNRNIQWFNKIQLSMSKLSGRAMVHMAWSERWNVWCRCASHRRKIFGCLWSRRCAIPLLWQVWLLRRWSRILQLYHLLRLFKAPRQSLPTSSWRGDFKSVIPLRIN